MYITFQPCHKFVNTGGTSPNYSCCDLLESLMGEGRNRLYVDDEIIIEPGLIYIKQIKKRRPVIVTNLIFKLKTPSTECIK